MSYNWNGIMSEQLPYSERLRLIKLGLLPKEAIAKPKKAIPKISEKKKKEMAELKDENGETELVKFFKSCMKRMTGHCFNCTAKTETKVYQSAIYSICHILDKRDTMCPSVKTHPCNWIELCPDCHIEFDTPPLEKDKTIWDKRQSMGIWPVVRDKLIMIYPDLHPSEHRHFPESVLKYIQKNNPF